MPVLTPSTRSPPSAPQGPYPGHWNLLGHSGCLISAGLNKHQSMIYSRNHNPLFPAGCRLLLRVITPAILLDFLSLPALLPPEFADAACVLEMLRTRSCCVSFQLSSLSVPLQLETGHGGSIYTLTFCFVDRLYIRRVWGDIRDPSRRLYLCQSHHGQHKQWK